MTKRQMTQSQPPSALAKFAILLLKLYRVGLSPILAFLGVRCRHFPTCSDYAMTSFSRHGAWRGFWLTLSRLSRCHPFGSHGWDPAPETLQDARWRPWRYGDWSWRARPAMSDDGLAAKTDDGDA